MLLSILNYLFTEQKQNMNLLKRNLITKKTLKDPQVLMIWKDLSWKRSRLR